MLDVGGESTRPGSDPVSADEELERVVPVIERLAELHPAIPISIDTRKAGVAAEALDAGATIVNDVSGGADPAMFDVVRDAGAAVVLMHMQGEPKTMQEAPQYDDVVGEVHEYLRAADRGGRARGDRPRADRDRPGDRVRQGPRPQPRADARGRRAPRPGPAGARRPVAEAVHRHDPRPAGGRARRGHGRRGRLDGRPGERTSSACTTSRRSSARSAWPTRSRGRGDDLDREAPG